MKRVFITGGAHGLGQAMVEAFAAQGNKVAFCDINEAGGEDVAAATGTLFMPCDVCDKDALERCLQRLADEWGDIDVVINNVGVGNFKPITEVTVEDFDRVIATNLRSAFITSRFLARHRESNGNTAYGRIVNLCSSRYLMSEPGTEGYAASKGGIYSLTHALSISLAPYRITVNAIAPGWIHVNEDEVLRPEDHDFHPSRRVGEPGDIARMALFLCEEKNDFVNGQTITVDGGVTRKMIYPE
ncbi:MAG: SDR family oxidoreductase [Bacteroidales bacterium]|uniref:SDR family NAD(P)-dependent oxidoreductase n=1 Tax=Sodaliphilus sp. TaxID=2815818 RepID=UPI001B5E3F81|nr:SDR family oxidoreductase [Candidatus Sodaliphilus limicaballi]